MNQITDDEFLARFENHTLGEFTHRDHLRVAFAYARRGGADTAVAGARRIRGFAEAAGATRKYHDTLTVAWARVVAHMAGRHPALAFGAFLDAHPELQRRDLMLGHYSKAVLFSDAARAGFVEPDLQPLP
jgi:hypothetical protein